MEDESDDDDDQLRELNFEFCAVFYAYKLQICFHKINEGLFCGMQINGFNHRNYTFDNLLVTASTRVIFVRSNDLLEFSAVNKEKQLDYVSCISNILTSNKSIIESPNGINLKKVIMEINFKNYVL